MTASSVVGYRVKAEMDADISQPEETLAIIAADSTTDNNTIYQWDGSQWTAVVGH